jgi:hypothetical protein
MELDTEFQKFKEYLDAPKMGVVNLVRQQELMDSYAKIKNIILSEDPDATVEIVEGALQLGSVAIRAVTSDVTVYDTAEFAEATKNADNFQIYPTADERVKLDILFEGVIEYTLVED